MRTLAQVGSCAVGTPVGHRMPAALGSRVPGVGMVIQVGAPLDVTEATALLYRAAEYGEIGSAAEALALLVDLVVNGGLCEIAEAVCLVDNARAGHTEFAEHLTDCHRWATAAVALAAETTTNPDTETAAVPSPRLAEVIA